MQKRTLGRTGLEVSVIGFGGIPIQRISKEESAKVIHYALNNGINFIDTARAYSDSEKKIGYALEKINNKPIVATKDFVTTKDDFNKSLELSLNNLNLKKIDIYQVHNVADEERLKKVLAENGALQGMLEAKEQGLIDFIGITGHKPEILLKAIRTDKFDTVHFPFNVIEFKQMLPVIKEANKRNIGIIIMKPLAGGALKLAKGALKFIAQYDVDVIIPGMDSVEQVKENIKSIDSELTEKEKKDLFKEAEKLGKEFCRMCEYCMPCPQGINIPITMVMDAYYTRYNLKEWAKKRYRELDIVKADKCIKCGICEKKCPYELPIRKIMERVKKNLL